MTKCNDSLNDEQRKIVENNHDLIYGYAHKMGISIDEYYDILAIGLCKAAKAFDESKGRFSTLAYCCMKNEMCRYYEGISKKSCVPDSMVVSYDAQDVRDDIENRKSFLEVLSDPQSYKNAESITMYQEFFDVLNDKEKVVVRYLLEGYTQTEIAEILNCKRQNLPINSIRRKIVDYINN